VIKGGAKIDPKGAKVPQGSVLAGKDLDQFKAQKGHIDQLLAKASAPATDQMAKAGTKGDRKS
jgi:hypothetical protein